MTSRVYLDLNALERGEVPIDGLGSLVDLVRHRITLRPALALVFWSDSSAAEDLQAFGRAQWRGGAWIAVLGELADVPHVEEPLLLPCVLCGTELYAGLVASGISRSWRCPECGFPVWAPLVPPIGCRRDVADAELRSVLDESEELVSTVRTNLDSGATRSNDELEDALYVLDLLVRAETEPRRIRNAARYADQISRELSR